MGCAVLDCFGFSPGSLVAAPKRAQRMGFEPQRPCCADRIDSSFLPPHRFITVTMQFTMMCLAQWNGELVTDFPPERTALRKPQMMGI